MISDNLFKKYRNNFQFIAILCAFFISIIFWYNHLKMSGSAYCWPASFLGSYFNLPWDEVGKNFWQSIWYYHIQLPLNIAYILLFEFILFPANDFTRGMPAYLTLHLILGVAALYSLCKIMELFKVHKVLYTVFLTIFVINPTFYFWFSQGTHDFVTTCLITISCYLFYLTQSNRDDKNYFFFFLTLAILINIRALYHPIFFFLPILFIMVLIKRTEWKKILITAAIPLIFALAPYIKNYFVFGKFTATTHAGRVLIQKTIEATTSPEERLQAVKNGVYSDAVFCFYEEDDMIDKLNIKYNGATYNRTYCRDVIQKKYYQQFLEKSHRTFPEIKIFTEGNNSLSRLGLNQQLEKDAISDLKYYPQHFLTRTQINLKQVFETSNWYFYNNMQNNRKLPANLHFKFGNQFTFIFIASAFTAILCGVLLASNSQKPEPIITIFFFTLLALEFILLFYDCNCSFSFLGSFYMKPEIVVRISLLSLVVILFFSGTGFFDRKKTGTPKPEALLAIFMICTILYSVVMALLLAGEEHQRYRTYINPLLLVLSAISVEMMIVYLASLKHKLCKTLKFWK